MDSPSACHTIDGDRESTTLITAIIISPSTAITPSTETMTTSVSSTMIALQVCTILFLSVAAAVPVVYGAGIGGIFSSQQQQQQHDVLSIDDVMPTFEEIQRQLLVESGITDNEDEMKSIIDGSDKSSLSATALQHHRRTQGGSGPELSFMIVSLLELHFNALTKMGKKDREIPHKLV